MRGGICLQTGTAAGYDNCYCDLHMWRLDRVSGEFAGARKKHG